MSTYDAMFKTLSDGTLVVTTSYDIFANVKENVGGTTVTPKSPTGDDARQRQIAAVLGAACSTPRPDDAM